VIAIHARCLVRTQDGHRAVLVAGLPIAHDAVGDAMAEGPSRRRQAELPPAAPSADPNLSGSAALAGPLRQARLAPPFQ
jgi:hypothetical protein